MVVPHQGEPLGERVGREQRPVEPPGLEPAGVGGARGRVAEQVGRRAKSARNAFVAAFAREHPVDGRAGAVGDVALELSARSRRTRPGGGASRPAQDSRARPASGGRVPTGMCS